MEAEKIRNWVETQLKFLRMRYGLEKFLDFKSCTLDEIHSELPQQLREKDSFYYLTLLYKIYLLESKSHIIMPCLEKIGNFFKEFPKIIGEIWDFFDQVLIRKIDLSNEEELIKLVKISKEFNEQGNFSSFGIGISKLNKNLITRIHSITTNPSHQRYMKLLNDLKQSCEIYENFDILIQYTIENALDFITNESKIIDNQSDKSTIAKNWIILKVLEKIPSINPKFSQSIEDFKNKFNPIAMKYNLEIIEVDFKDEEIWQTMTSMNSNISIAEIRPSGCSLNTKKSDSLNIISNIYLGYYKKELVCLKIYQELKQNLGNFKSVEEEISIYEKLSLKSNENNCFLKYYGTCLTTDRSKKTIYLVMQYVSNNLLAYMNELDRLESSNCYGEVEEKLRKLFSNLINSFIEMHNMKIYHLDIKPANILIENDHPFIIDFDVSVTKKEEQTSATEGVDNKFVGTRGYAAPEIQDFFDKRIQKKYFLRKADVFSLGMTFYHMIKRKNFEFNLNSSHMEAKLKDGIHKIKYMWAIPILKGMLDFNSERRINFTQAQALLDCGLTQSYEPLDYYDEEIQVSKKEVALERPLFKHLSKKLEIISKDNMLYFFNLLEELIRSRHKLLNLMRFQDRISKECMLYSLKKWGKLNLHVKKMESKLYHCLEIFDKAMILYHKMQFDILKKNISIVNIQRQNYAKIIFRLENIINFKNIIKKATIKTQKENIWYCFNVWKELTSYQCVPLTDMDENRMKFKLYCCFEIFNKNKLLCLKKLFDLLKNNKSNFYEKSQNYAKMIRKLEGLINFKRIKGYLARSRKENMLNYFTMWKELIKDKLVCLKFMRFMEIRFKEYIQYCFNILKELIRYQEMIKIKLCCCINIFNKNVSLNLKKSLFLLKYNVDDYIKKIKNVTEMTRKLENLINLHDKKIMLKVIKHTTNFIKTRFYEKIEKKSNLPMLNQNNLDYIGMCLECKNFGDIIINICDGQLSNQNVSIKIYQNNKNTDFSPIINSIAMQEYLHLLSSENNCFQKILGIVKSFDSKIKSMMLITPWMEHKLIDLIVLMESWSFNKKEQIIRNIFAKLLNSFSLMHSLKLYHLNINPENILMDTDNASAENWKPYITGIDLKIIEGAYKSNEIECKRQYSKGNVGFSDPIMLNSVSKNIFDKEKADVFSLGMTFLNVVMGKRFRKNLSTDESRLKMEVENISSMWIKELISGMVKFDNEKRLKMSEAQMVFSNQFPI